MAGRILMEVEGKHNSRVRKARCGRETSVLTVILRLADKPGNTNQDY